MNILQLLDTILNGPARYIDARNFSPELSLLLIFGVLFLEIGVAYLLIYLFIKLLQYSRTIFSLILQRFGVGKQEITYTFLQLVFPADTTKSAYATEQLHILMQSMVKYQGFWSSMAARKQPYSLELVATRSEGIRYIIRVPKQEVEVIRRTILSFLPGVKITETDDYMSRTVDMSCGIAELKLTEDFVLPLADHKALAEHDPIAYLTGHMRSLLPDELVAFQVVAVPVLDNTHPNELRHIRHTRHRIALSKELGPKLTAYKIDIARILLRVAIAPLWLAGMGIKIIINVIESIATNDLPADWKEGQKRSPDNPYEHELSESIKTKLDQHLFEVSMRVLVASPDIDSIHSRVNSMVSSFGTFTSTYQSITMGRALPFAKTPDKWLAHFNSRTLSRHIFSQQTIVSSSELSDLYHFPNTDLTKTEGLIKSRSRDLPAPLSFKGDSKLDVVVGVNEFDGETQEIGMALAQRQKHTYIIGKTGTGKTTLLLSSIYQDMLNGKGLAVFDPHGDMFRELLAIVPEHRRKDVVVFDPSDREYPLGLNILDPGIDFEDEDDKQEWITSSVLSVFAKLADENQWGPRMEHILRNTTLTALQTPNPSLYTLQQLLTNKKYQKEVAKGLKDPVLKQFWEKEFKMMGSMQMSSATAPLTHRLGHFITAKMSRHILLQEKSTVRIADIMNEGKILLVNLSKGDIGEDQSFFFGTILTSFIWMAAYQRTKIPEKKRRDFFVYDPSPI